jgi:alpha-beta hydrolase superfamily lysophospholipase
MLLFRQPGSLFYELVVSSVLIVLLFCMHGCAGPQLQARPDRPLVPASLEDDAMVMQDGYRLPLRRWLPAGHPRALVLALHGFNDYANAFTDTASYLMQRAMAIYAIDQRGFGRSAQSGLWAGEMRMQDDLLAAADLLCRRYPNRPLYLLGESMGGAVILAAASMLDRTCAAGVILSAPAVWGWETMPWWQATVLRAVAHVAPAWTVTGEGLDIRPSDNIDMLRALGRDPLVIKATRIDAIYGLTDLMQAAYAGSEQLRLPTLLLYGEQDEIITPLPVCGMLKKVNDFSSLGWRMLLYPDGFHMLTRDLQADVVRHDIAAWINDHSAAAPSGFEVDQGSPRLQAVCRGHRPG